MRFAIGLLVVALLGAGARAEIEVHPLTDGGNNYHPSLNDGWVTWVGWDGDSYEIMIANLDSPVIDIATLTDDGGDKEHPSSSGNAKIVWQGRGNHGSDWEIYVYHRDSIPRWAPLTDNEVHDRYPSLGAGGNIAWLVAPEVHYWNESLHRETVISDPCCPASSFTNERPSAHGFEVAWRAYGREGGTKWVLWDGAADTLAIPDGTSPSLYDGTLAYVGRFQDDWHIFYWDGVEANPVGGVGFAPSLHDGAIAYEFWDGRDWEIHYWDGSEVIPITDNDFNDTQPSLYADKLAWVGRPETLDQIYYATGLPEPAGAAGLAAAGATLAALRARRAARRRARRSPPRQ